MGTSRIAARQLRAVWAAPRGAFCLRSKAGNTAVHSPVAMHAIKNAARLPTATTVSSSKRCCVARPQVGPHMLLSRFQLHRLLALKQKTGATHFLWSLSCHFVGTPVVTVFRVVVCVFLLLAWLCLSFSIVATQAAKKAAKVEAKETAAASAADGNLRLRNSLVR